MKTENNDNNGLYNASTCHGNFETMKIHVRT
jgi:hypothetical protein